MPSERRARRPEGDAASAPRLPERAPRTSAPPPRRDRVDPWFLKPYEPAKPVAAAVEVAAASSVKPARHKIAALLGGGPKG